MPELTPESRIDMLEAELAELKWQASMAELSAGELERLAANRSFQLQQMQAIPRWSDTTRPVTVAVVRAEFAAFVERCAGEVGEPVTKPRRPWTKKNQAIMWTALDALDDIIEGRMRVVRKER